MRREAGEFMIKYPRSLISMICNILQLFINKESTGLCDNKNTALTNCQAGVMFGVLCILTHLVFPRAPGMCV
jgi:hypothetical protein